MLEACAAAFGMEYNIPVAPNEQLNVVENDFADANR